MKRHLVLVLALALAACNAVDLSYTRQTRVVRDAPITLSELNVPIQPKGRQYEPLTALFYPFWISQKTTYPAHLGRVFGRIVHQVFASERLFPRLIFDEKLAYSSPENAVETARRMGLDLVILGFVPYFVEGSTLSDTAVTIELRIYETKGGQLLVQMEQAARVEARMPNDFVYFVQETRLPDSPLYLAIQAIARDMAVPLKSWLPGLTRRPVFASNIGEITRALSVPGNGARANGVNGGLDAQARSELERELAAQGRSVALKVEFDVDKATIRPESFPLLDSLGQALAGPELAGKRVEILGHTDADASQEYNLKLSRARAQAVADYLVTKCRIPAGLIRTEGFGKSRPIAQNDTPENKQLNRRVEVRLEG